VKSKLKSIKIVTELKGEYSMRMQWKNRAKCNQGEVSLPKILLTFYSQRAVKRGPA